MHLLHMHLKIIITMSSIVTPLTLLWFQHHPPEGRAAAEPVPGLPEESRIRPSICESWLLLRYCGNPV